jgi:hypothetical protein
MFIIISTQNSHDRLNDWDLLRWVPAARRRELKTLARAHTQVCAVGLLARYGRTWDVATANQKF